MYRKYVRYFLIFSVIACTALFFYSCSNFKKIQKSTNISLKYQKAVEFYQNEDYTHALQLFDELLIYYRGNDTSEKISYYYAYCYYGMGDYLEAGYFFLKFTKTFPISKFTEECLFMSCYCQYLYSPEYYQDQTITKDAIKQLQLFIDHYPNSERVEECNKLIDELRGKLETKLYEIANLYVDIESYKAAVTTYKNLLKEFPDTRYREITYYKILKSNYEYACKSVTEKKKERFLAADDAYNTFMAIYPESIYLKDANLIKENIAKELAKINNKNIENKIN